MDRADEIFLTIAASALVEEVREGELIVATLVDVGDPELGLPQEGMVGRSSHRNQRRSAPLGSACQRSNSNCSIGGPGGVDEVRIAPAAVSAQSCARLSSCALIATTTVLADMKTAPSAGVSSMSQRASTPAASGIATML